MTETKDQKAERLAAALRANLRRRKGQQRGRADLSGRDPNRTDTPLQQGSARDLGEASATAPDRRPDPATPVSDDHQT